VPLGKNSKRRDQASAFIGLAALILADHQVVTTRIAE
jgi:hypothetical protein